MNTKGQFLDRNLMLTKSAQCIDPPPNRSDEHTFEPQSPAYISCSFILVIKKPIERINVCVLSRQEYLEFDRQL